MNKKLLGLAAAVVAGGFLLGVAAPAMARAATPAAPGDPAPSCVARHATGTGPVTVFLKNNCAQPQRVRIVLTDGLGSTCTYLPVAAARTFTFGGPSAFTALLSC